MAPRLDLKLFVHHGSFVHSRIAGRDELAGPDVILAHRLLKGRVASERTSGFAQITAAAATALGVADPGPDLVPEPESFEHVGDVDTYVIDLDERWAAERDQRRLAVDPARAIVDEAIDLAAEPADAWAFLTSPALRPTWEGPIVITELAGGGRRGVGTMASCVTGRLATLEEIVDWQPFDHVGWRLVVPAIGSVDAEADLVPTGAGTRLRIRWATASTVPAADLERLREERRTALDRLAGVLADRARGDEA
jgi:hypothetical protein